MRLNPLLLASLSFLFLSPTFAQTPENPTPSPAAANAVQKIVVAVDNAKPGTPSTKQIENTVHQYLMKKPEVVVEALQAYQQKQMESMQQMFKDTQKIAPKYANDLFRDKADPVGGNVNGKVTVVEFSDYQCSHCIETAGIVEAAIKADPNLRVVIKEFPIRGGVSDVAARAALAANKQGKYWEFHTLLFKNGNALSNDKIFELAKTAGLDVDKLKKDMEEADLRKTVENTQKLALNLKLMGTPAFFVAKSDIKTDAPSKAINYIPGVVTQQQLQTIIDQVKK